MPGYIMHLAEGRLLEEALCDRGFLKGERDLSLFQDGLLLPDTKRKKEKITSHFWNEKNLTRLAIPPDLELFYEIQRKAAYTGVSGVLGPSASGPDLCDRILAGEFSVSG